MTKNILFRLATIVLLFLSLPCALLAQNTETATVRENNPMRNYLRPSISVFYIQRGNDYKIEQTIEQIKALGISRKFDINQTSSDVINIDDMESRLDTTQLKKFLEENFAREIVSNWFPRFISKKDGYSMDVIAERGMFSATDADVITSRSSVRQEAMLKDAGLNLIDRSYILIYDIKSIETTKEGNWVANSDIYIYKLDWSDEVSETFYQQWGNPNAISEIHFPIELVAAVTNAKQLKGLVGTEMRTNTGVVTRTQAQDLAQQIYDNADVYAGQRVEDFKAKAPVYSINPITSKLGEKEGVKPERRYFVYQLEADEQGDVTAKRKGVVRASNKIAKNDTIATGDSELTRFYQTQGGKIREGMLMQENPDFGISIGGYVTYNEVGAYAEYNMSKLLSKYIGNIPILGAKVFIRGGYPFGQKQDADQQRLYLGIGAMKEFNFMRFLTVTPYLGYADAPEVKQNGVVVQKELTGFIAGAKAGANLSPSVNVFVMADFNSLKSTISKCYADSDTNISPFSLGVGFHIAF
ncbi:MAG TPA: hypothetical protein GXZ87_03805 [Bacteroidales bacterium]|nr:hypothetical protein [Bacteroidales bacterium]